MEAQEGAGVSTRSKNAARTIPAMPEALNAATSFVRLLMSVPLAPTQAATLRSLGAMNSGPTGSVIV
jgi:hypothetical protein